MPLAFVLSLLVAACAARDSVPSAPRPLPSRAYLLPPYDGWSGDLDPRQHDLLASAFTALARDGAVSAARDAAAGLLSADPGLLPAEVLAAQAELVADAPAAAADRLGGWVSEHPEYRAARLAWGRVMELRGDVAGAYGEYRALAAGVPVAGERATALHDAALAAARAGLAAASSSSRLDQVRAWSDRIVSWEGPESTDGLEARLALARAEGAEATELELLRTLSGRGGAGRDRVERLAALELDRGDPAEGLRLLQGLVAAEPDDRVLRSQLADAQVRFRLRLLPETVRQLGSRAELRRAELAALLYWLVPGVRQSQGGAARIASDVLDHPWQREIVRVVNRGLMTVDPVLHRFDPDRRLSRVEALRAALRLSASRAQAACGHELDENPSPGPASVCEAAVQCSLLAAADECLPEAGISGPEAIGILGRALAAAE